MKPSVFNLDSLDWAVLDRLRDIFLAGNPGGARYGRSRSDLENYGATFPQRIAWKWLAVVGALRLRGWTPPYGSLLDWGCGSGIAGRCVIEFFGVASFNSLRVWDRSPLAVAFAAEKALESFPSLRVEPCHSLPFGGSLEGAIPQPRARKTRNTEHASPSPGCSPRPSDGRGVRGEGGPTPERDRSSIAAGAESWESKSIGTLIVSHVLNELDETGRRALRQAVDRAGAVLWVEPGTYADSRSLIALREGLRESFHVIAPCTHQAACGLRAPENERHWCHHFAKPPANITADPDWVRFAQRVGIDLRSLPYSFLVVERKGLREPVPGLVPDGCSRIIGAPRFHKGYAKIFSCQSEGVRDLTLQKRDSPEFFRNLRRGNGSAIYRWTAENGGPFTPSTA